MNTYLFRHPMADLIYLFISIILMSLKTSISIKVIIIPLILYAITNVLADELVKEKRKLKKTEASCIVSSIVWAIVSLVYHWNSIYLLTGFALYQIANIIFILVYAKIFNKDLYKLNKKTINKLSKQKKIKLKNNANNKNNKILYRNSKFKDYKIIK